MATSSSALPRLSLSIVLGGVLVATLIGCAKKEATKPTGQLIRMTRVQKHPAVTPPQFKKPPHVKGIYVTAWSAGSKSKLAKLIGLIERTELNAVVIDIRDAGQMYFPTGIKLADAAVGKRFIAVRKPKDLLKQLAEHQIWPIARIACFRDDYLPKIHPELAVQTSEGKVWKDAGGHTWLNPYDKRNWQYLHGIVDYALRLGFPEVQLDYVRFPSEGAAKTQVFPTRSTFGESNVKPEDVIFAFSKSVVQRIKKYKALSSADIFGIISSSKKDEGIGQSLEKIAAPYDVVSPMIYPSHFARGEYGIADPNNSPSAIISKSLADYKKRIPKKNIRPWLQDFSLFGVKYDAKMVRAQIDSVQKAGYKEWLLWNASSTYTETALRKKPTSDKVLH